MYNGMCSFSEIFYANCQGWALSDVSHLESSLYSEEE